MSNEQSYDIICGQWNDYRMKCKINKCIVEFAGLLKPGSKILDIGCGTGYPIASYFVRRGFSVTGIDISKNMIERANLLKLPNAVFLSGDILSFKTTKKFDGIVAFDSLWHIDKAKQRELYRIISSLLNKQGCFLFTHGKTESSVTGEMFGQKFTYHALDAADVKKLLAANGLDIISCIEDYKEESSGERDLLIVAQKL